MSQGNACLLESIASEIVAGLDKTFTSMLGVVPKLVAQESGNDKKVVSDVSGIIAIVGQGLNGTLVISFPKDTILGLLENIYRKKFDELTPAVKAGVGEITNIVYGVTKTSLNKRGFALKMAIPSVIVGDHHVVTSVSMDRMLTLLFNTDKGSFCAQITVTEGEIQSG